MAKPVLNQSRRDLTIVGLAPPSGETLREIARVVPPDFRGTIFVVSDAGKGGPSRSTNARRHRDRARLDAAAYAGLRLRPLDNEKRSRKRA